MTTALDVFDQHRRLLFTVAYQMLGSVADAEDTVQDAWLRWSAAGRDDVEDPRAYLVQVTTRLAIDRSGSALAARPGQVEPQHDAGAGLVAQAAQLHRARPAEALGQPPLQVRAGQDQAGARKVGVLDQWDVAVIGAGTRAEIWDAEAWNSYLEDQENAFSETDEEVLPGIF